MGFAAPIGALLQPIGTVRLHLGQITSYVGEQSP